LKGPKPCFLSAAAIRGRSLAAGHSFSATISKSECRANKKLRR
jgi:hypothetical protein